MKVICLRMAEKSLNILIFCLKFCLLGQTFFKKIVSSLILLNIFISLTNSWMLTLTSLTSRDICFKTFNLIYTDQSINMTSCSSWYQTKIIIDQIKMIKIKMIIDQNWCVIHLPIWFTWPNPARHQTGF